MTVLNMSMRSLSRFTRLAVQQAHFQRAIGITCQFAPHRAFHVPRRDQTIKPFLLADIGEGIRECEIIQWFVEPEARVEEWDKLCEVQSDKASVEITSRFAGVIKKLHYEAGDMAKVGKPLVDIDIQSEVNEKDLEALTGGEESQTQADEVLPSKLPATLLASPNTPLKPLKEEETTGSSNHISTKDKSLKPKGTHAGLATPAVRHLTKELKVDLADINGTGRDGRVLKEDVHEFARQRAAEVSPKSHSQPTASAADTTQQKETIIPLTNMQAQMFKSMTKALAKPHFLYADEIDFKRVSELRSRMNKGLAKSPIGQVNKLSYMPFLIKAISLSLQKYPLLNARVDSDAGSGKPVIVHRSQHNIGVAMDTPSGLLVPVIKNAAGLNILEIAAELIRLQSLAMTGKLSTQDLTGGTITLSNIGNVGGTYVSPVIVEKEVAILGVGRIRTVPAFGADGKVIPKLICNFSWSADHRVIDGATMARAADLVKNYIEEPDSMVMHLR